MSSLPPPAAVYPRSTPTSSSHHSRGSFGPVFIVLAVITILAAVACFLGRACARRHSRQQGRPCRAFTKRDLEDGFEIGIPTGRLTMNGVAKEGKPSETGATKSQAKQTENGAKPGA